MDEIVVERENRSAGGSGRKKGNLRIGDHWNAIHIIALSQSNPLKAIAEFVENSIDAKAKLITIVRGKEAGKHFLRIVDDGTGIPKDDDGAPNFKYVATHICDSLKRQMRQAGSKGVQGEFGIGLLSFWTVGEELTLRSTSIDGRMYQMRMKKGDPSYTITERKSLLAQQGTDLMIRPILSGVRGLSGEKLQWYLSSELRNRIIDSNVVIKIIDRNSRSELIVEPQRFSGRRLFEIKLPEPGDMLGASLGDVKFELYLSDPAPTNHIALYRLGTRVFPSIADLEEFSSAPWNSGHFQGFIDFPSLTLTPGTRLGIVRDEQFATVSRALDLLGPQLSVIIEEQKRAAEERASKATLSTLHRAFKEALLALPPEEYDWFDVHKKPSRSTAAVATAAVGETPSGEPLSNGVFVDPEIEDSEGTNPQKQFFEFPGPLFKVVISPVSSIVLVNTARDFIAKAFDRKRTRIDSGIDLKWRVCEGRGVLSPDTGEFVSFQALAEPGLVKIEVVATQREISVSAQSIITVAGSLLENSSKTRDAQGKGLPAYTLQNSPGERWRAMFDSERNLVIVNSGHKDFLFAARNQTLKVRYLCRLYSKELILSNFPGLSPSELLERLIEISLYAEENLR